MQDPTRWPVLPEAPGSLPGQKRLNSRFTSEREEVALEERNRREDCPERHRRPGPGP